MKVAIVGGGISGLFLASRLAEKSEVFLFEKKETVGGKACSALYSARIFEFLPESKKFIKNKIDFCLIHFPKKTVKLQFKKSFFVFDREKLEKELFLKTQKKRVKIFLSFKVEREHLTKFEKEFDKIIGCDGAYSTVREYLNLPKQKFLLGIQGFVFKKDKETLLNFVETWPTKNGFFWKIPGGTYLEYGILEKSTLARNFFSRFCQDRKLNLEKIRSAILPQNLILPSHSKITLCGDAAGLIKPWSGGGVIWGLIGAKILLESFPDFLQYQKKLKSIFVPQIFLSKKAKKLVYFFGKKFPLLFPKQFKIDGDFLFPL